jgi:hypothetical protein
MQRQTRCIAPYREADAGYAPEVMRDPVKRRLISGDHRLLHGMSLTARARCFQLRSEWLGQGRCRFGPSDVQRFSGSWEGATAPNITSDAEKGLGRWRDAEIKRALAQGISRDGRQLRPPMGFSFYRGISEPDLDAIVANLRTVPPLQQCGCSDVVLQEFLGGATRCSTSERARSRKSLA